MPRWPVITTKKLLYQYGFFDLPALCMNMKPETMRELKVELERLAERAAMIAAYIEEREGYGCGDRGHKHALKALNRAGKMIHCKVFGYNAFYDLSF